jgi:hypothetical protein
VIAIEIFRAGVVGSIEKFQAGYDGSVDGFTTGSGSKSQRDFTSEGGPVLGAIDRDRDRDCIFVSWVRSIAERFSNAIVIAIEIFRAG